MDRVVEQAEWNQRVFIPLLDGLRGLLEARQHRALAAGQMLAGVSVFTDLGKNILHQPELVGHKGIGFDKVILTSIPLQV